MREKIHSSCGAASKALVNFLCWIRTAKEFADQRTRSRLASIIDNFFGDGDFLRVSLTETVHVFIREWRQSMELGIWCFRADL